LYFYSIFSSLLAFSASSHTDQTIPVSLKDLKSIQIYENLLFAGYQDDYILIFRITDSNRYAYDHIVSVKYKDEDSMPINSFLAYNQQLWVSAGYVIYVFSLNNRNTRNPYNLIMKQHSDDDHLLTMLGFSDYVWAGSSRGNVYVFRMDNYEIYKTFEGHKDGVCCLCPMLDMYIISGSQQFDTSIVIWDNVSATENVASTRF
jgi:WD40 repeat protein